MSSPEPVFNETTLAVHGTLNSPLSAVPDVPAGDHSNGIDYWQSAGTVAGEFVSSSTDASPSRRQWRWRGPGPVDRRTDRHPSASTATTGESSRTGTTDKRRDGAHPRGIPLRYTQTGRLTTRQSAQQGVVAQRSRSGIRTTTGIESWWTRRSGR
jgi:hypothetical protein